jgi:uncharacterized protein
MVAFLLTVDYDNDGIKLVVRKGNHARGRPSSRLGDIDRQDYAILSRRWRGIEFALPGTVLGHSFRPDSDLDVRVTFAPGASRRGYDLFSMQEEPERMFGHPVDLEKKRLMEFVKHCTRREHIFIR